jgi:hypothetical protein
MNTESLHINRLSHEVANKAKPKKLYYQAFHKEQWAKRFYEEKCLVNKTFQMHELGFRKESYSLSHSRHRKMQKQNTPKAGEERHTFLVATAYVWHC